MILKQILNLEVVKCKSNWINVKLIDSNKPGNDLNLFLTLRQK